MGVNPNNAIDLSVDILRMSGLWLWMWRRIQEDERIIASSAIIEVTDETPNNYQC